MHERQRWQIILSTLAERTVATVGELADLTGSSPATVRRDVSKLAAQGLLRRVHGGAQGLVGAPAPQGARALVAPDAVARQSPTAGTVARLAQKRAIAREAAALCRDGDSVIINGGTTTFQMVAFLAERHMQVLTNSFPLADALLRSSRNRVLLPGGEVHREQGIVLSPYDDDALRHHWASVMFMSGQALAPLGLMESDPLLIRAEQKLLDRADRLVVLADSSKFSGRGGLILCPLARIHTLVTDDGADPRSLAMCRDAGIAVIVVHVEAAAAPSARPSPSP